MPTLHPILPHDLWNPITHLLVKLVSIGLTLEQANHTLHWGLMNLKFPQRKSQHLSVLTRIQVGDEEPNSALHLDGVKSVPICATLIVTSWDVIHRLILHDCCLPVLR